MNKYSNNEQPFKEKLKDFLITVAFLGAWVVGMMLYMKYIFNFTL